MDWQVSQVDSLHLGILHTINLHSRIQLPLCQNGSRDKDSRSKKNWPLRASPHSQRCEGASGVHRSNTVYRHLSKFAQSLCVHHFVSDHRQPEIYSQTLRLRSGKDLEEAQGFVET